MNFPLLKTYEKILGESLLKCKNKRNLYIVCSLSQSSYPWYKFHILQLSLKKNTIKTILTRTHVYNLACWERYNQPHIKYSFKRFV